MGEVIRIKPHHFVDILTRAGEASPRFEPHPYGHALHTVAERVLRDPETLLRLELGADDICAPCVHNVAGRCDDLIDTTYRPDAPREKQRWNLLIDRRWCERLNLQQRDVLTVRHLARRVQECTASLCSIYRELPADRVTQRLRLLELGLRRLLEP